MSDTSSSKSVERIFTEQYVYPDWFTKKKYQFYKKTLDRLRKLRFTHSRAGDYYSKMSMYVFGPSIGITAISGIASFMSTSEIMSQETQTSFGISVGVMASISTMLQSVASVCQFNAKNEAFRTAADEYNKLMVRVKFEMEMPDEPDFTNDLEKNILDIQNKCKYLPPQFIINEWTKKKKKDTIEELKFKEDVNDLKKHSFKKYGTFIESAPNNDENVIVVIDESNIDENSTAI
jgi:hypothetical protein